MGNGGYLLNKCMFNKFHPCSPFYTGPGPSTLGAMYLPMDELSLDEGDVRRQLPEFNLWVVGNLLHRHQTPRRTVCCNPYFQIILPLSRREPCVSHGRFACRKPRNETVYGPYTLYRCTPWFAIAFSEAQNQIIIDPGCCM